MAQAHWRRYDMTREELILAALAPAQGSSHTPVQVQKLFFLLDTNVAKQLGGRHFNFQPYHYGPFDPEVYDALNEQAARGLVDIDQNKWKTYRLTVDGQRRGEELLNTLDKNTADYLRNVSTFVRSLSFTKLVASIYKKYPEMRKNSVFQG
jgi:uncharacterized protein